ncbi:MAG: class I SAM-dependent methyltransferase [Gammaproteobacteria bacterium]|nr:class I SAM-dependent methyltransferase [Gammaproteobacteria bacterium]
MPQPPMTDFDARAETWDDANKVKRAEEVAAAMRRAVPLSRSMKALEYGAGTGLLSFSLRDALGPITLADSAAGMRAVAERKIATTNARDMRVIDLDLMRDPVPSDRYDLVFSMMTLHHVPNVPRVLAAFHALLSPSGWLCLADLDAEDGSFHGPEADVHRGFERGTLRSWLAVAAFTDVSISDCCSIRHGERRYSIFLAACRKP